MHKNFDPLVSSFMLHLEHFAPQSRIAFIADTTLTTAAFFFALWHRKLIACPLNRRLPQSAINTALRRLRSDAYLNPNELPLIKGKKVRSLWDESALATMLFTSGTEGEPKIACHILANHIESAKSALVALHLDKQDSYLLSLPLFHVSGIAILLRVFLAKAHLLFSEKMEKATHISMVPTQLYRLMQDPKKLEKVVLNSKCLLVGGAPLFHSLYKQAKKSGLKILTTYGLTEMSSMVSCDQGTILPHVELYIAKDSEIFVRGRSLFQGYLEQDQLVLPLKQGWFATKDLGELSENNKLHLLGRKDHLFISGGENIQPEEIEEALTSLRGIAQAIVIPRFDLEFGARPVAYIYEKQKLWTLEKIRKKLADKLPSYKLPIQVVHLPRFYEKQERKNLINGSGIETERPVALETIT